MVSEGRIATIATLLAKARISLEGYHDEEDDAFSDELVHDAKKLLDDAAAHLQLLDKPLPDTAQPFLICDDP